MTESRFSLDFTPNPHGHFPDGEAYANPFHAMLANGRAWAEDGMNQEEIVAAAQELGGEPRGRNGTENLSNFANEFVARHSSEAPNRLAVVDEIADIRAVILLHPEIIPVQTTVSTAVEHAQDRAEEELGQYYSPFVRQGIDLYSKERDIDKVREQMGQYFDPFVRQGIGIYAAELAIHQALQGEQ